MMGKKTHPNTQAIKRIGEEPIYPIKNNLNVALLTTDTPRHNAFAEQTNLIPIYEGIPKADIYIVYGRGKLKPRPNMINLHGGDPEKYRGLDSHLWAIYHNDYNFITTLHKVNEKLDDGDIILQGKLPLFKGMNFEDLLNLNNLMCVDLILCALDMFKRLGYFLSRPQKTKGRYYSAMPEEFKLICKEKFEQRLKDLPISRNS